MASPLDQLRARLAFIKSQSANLRPAVEKIGQQWRKDRKRDFDSQGRTTLHGRWQSNAASTIKRKGHSRILRGLPSKGFQLQESVIKRNHVNHIFRWSPGAATIELGTKDQNARRHQLGLGRGGIIRRAIDPTINDRRKYANTITRWIFRGKL